MRYLIAVLVWCSVIFQGAVPSSAAETGTVPTIAFLPLEVSRTGEYAYLNSAIRQMLISRLTEQGDIAVADPAFSSDELRALRELVQSGNAGEAAARTSADWLVDGSMYSMKEGVQVNLVFHPAAPDRKPAPYTLRAENTDDIMPAIAGLVAEIKAALFAAGEQGQSDGEQDPAGAAGLSGFQTAHPERAYKTGLFGGASLIGGEQDDRFQSKGIRKSATIPLSVVSVTLGDLDGDGEQELIAASRSRLRLFSFEEGRFVLRAEHDLSPYLKIHALNIADPGDTGRQKLYVSANEGKNPASAIFTWDGSAGLQPVQSDIRWYIRPLWWPGKGIIVAGQKDSPNISDNFLAPGVYELEMPVDGGRLERGEKLLLPPDTNLFDFVVADLSGDGEMETMVVDKHEKLLVYDSALNLVWVSSANYGGSKNFFGPPLSASDRLDPNAYTEAQNAMRKLVYIPGRLVTKDITGDGLPEVVVSTNEAGAAPFLDNVRSYDGGSVACLTWRGAGLLELWRTNHIPGYVADYAFDSTGEAEAGATDTVLNRLYVAQIPDSNIWEIIVPGRDNSKILAYEMTVRKENQ